MCTASFEKGYCYRTYATNKTQTVVSSSKKVGNNRLFTSIMRFPLPFTNNHQREIKEVENDSAAVVVVRNIDDMRQQLQVPSTSSEWGAAPTMTTNRVGGMRRVRSANASRPRQGGGGGVGGGGGDASSSSARSHSQEARSSSNSSNNTVFGSPPPPSEQLPIPQCESTLLEIARNKSDHTDLRRMYDYATWNMYDRIVSARNKKRLSELENGGGGDDDDDDDNHVVVASSSSPSSSTKSSTSSSSSSSPSKNNNKPSPTVTTAATSCNSSFTSNSPSQANNNNKGSTSNSGGGGSGVLKTTTTTSAAVAAKTQHNHDDAAAANSTTSATTSTATTTTKSIGNEAPLTQEKQQQHHYPSTTKNTTTSSSSSNNATQPSSSSLRHKLRSINKAFSSQDTDSSQGGGSGTSDVTLATAESDYSSSSGCNSPATFPGCMLLSSSSSRQRTMSQDYADDDHFIFQLDM